MLFALRLIGIDQPFSFISSQISESKTCPFRLHHFGDLLSQQQQNKVIEKLERAIARIEYAVALPARFISRSSFSLPRLTSNHSHNCCHHLHPPPPCGSYSMKLSILRTLAHSSVPPTFLAIEAIGMM